jgi:CheY-like chemotaxis protein
MMSTVPLEAAMSANDIQRVLILVVERNPVVQRLERYFLEQPGFSVDFATDGRSALKRAQEIQPDLLVTEILVPELDGLSLCREIKSDPLTSHIIVLIFSHLHAEDRAMEAGADAFLVKPISEELLIKTVEKLMTKHKRTKAAETFV